VISQAVQVFTTACQRDCRKIALMPTKPAGSALSKDAEKRVRQELSRILASGSFQQADRLKRFLSFIVLEAASGRGDGLKEYVVGVQVFGKEESFDPRTDPVVRVQARRLRARLVRYYREEGQNDEILIELPKGGYAPQFTRRESAGPTKRSISTALVSRNTVAVLPFTDHSATQELEYFCRGVRDEVVHNLTKIGKLRVLAWDPEGVSGNRDPREVLQKPDAAAIVSGSVRRAGNTVRVTTQIIDGASGCYLWSESADASIDEVFAAQERIARAIAGKLEPQLLEAGEAGVSGRMTTNLAAYNLFLQGRYHLNQRTEEGLRKAAEFFERALVEDSQYALAHSGLADAYGLLAHYGVLGPAEVWSKAASSAATAVMLDGSSAEAHTSLAHVKATQDWDWRAAEMGYHRAIALNPRYATAHHWFAASCLAPLGRLDEALEHMLLAQSLDPVSSIIARDVATIYYYRREFEAALDQCDHTIELNPFFSAAYWTLGLIQEQRKEFDESAAAFQRAAHLSPRSPRMQAALARNCALMGDRRQATDTLRQLEAIAKDRYVSPADFAWVYFALERPDVGFQWLTKASDDRCFEMLFVKVDPRFDPIRSDRRFAGLVRSLKLG
jgi:serine/threonine-protein kinase